MSLTVTFRPGTPAYSGPLELSFGARGARGLTGATGATGPAGADGADGADGQDGLTEIGGAITGATAGRDLYVGAGPVLAEDDGTVALTTGPRVVTGTLTARQSGGTPGTDEVQISHDGTRSIIETKDGHLYIPVNSARRLRIGNDPGGYYLDIYQDGAFLQFSTNSAFVPIRGTPWDFGSGIGLSGAVSFDVRLDRAAGKVMDLGDNTGGGATFRSIPLTPSQITADQNNYAPGVARFYRLSTDASRTVTGLSVSQVNGQECEFWNVGSSNLVLAHQSGSSTAANRFVCTGGADITLAADEVALLRYDAVTSRWRVRKV